MAETDALEKSDTNKKKETKGDTEQDTERGREIIQNVYHTIIFWKTVFLLDFLSTLLSKGLHRSVEEIELWMGHGY